MKKISKEELTEILRKHKNWLDTGIKNENSKLADLQHANLQHADLRKADLRCADLRKADLSYTYLSDADLRCADLRNANLQCANLQRADLQHANLQRADLRKADLRCADLRCADFKSTYLEGADLRGAKEYAFCSLSVEEKGMTLKQYKEEVKRTMNYKIDEQDRLKMLSMGLSGEVGEVIEVLKKFLFHDQKLNKKHLKKELGDVFWYLVNICNEFDFNPQEIFQLNIKKLKKRYPEGFDQKRSINREL